MKTTKTKASATPKKLRNTKRTGSDKATSAPPRKRSGTEPNADPARANSKLATIIKLLRRNEGATLAQPLRNTRQCAASPARRSGT